MASAVGIHRPLRQYLTKAEWMSELGYVTEFVRSIHRDLTPGSFDESTGLWFSRPGQGSLFFSREESRTYAGVVSRLVKQYAKHEEMSRRAVERSLQDVLFEALDLQSRSKAAFEQRLASEVARLQQRLKEPTSLYTCYVPLCGLATEGLPSTIGKVRLVVMNATQHRRLLRPDGVALSAIDAARRRQALATLKGADSWGSAAAVVKVRARDNDAAHHLARRQARRLIDTLNFFADMIPNNHGWLYLPGENAASKTEIPVLRENGNLSLLMTSEGPMVPVSLARLRAEPLLRTGLHRVHQLMQDDGKSSLADVLVTAVQWAGRASVEPTNEQAFLLFVVALETLMLPESNAGELTYRLRIRVAHLLGRSASARAELSGAVGDLYGIRSKIAHSGFYEVTDEDLGRLRSVVKRCILRALLHRRIRQLKTDAELSKWFESKVLE